VDFTGRILGMGVVISDAHLGYMGGMETGPTGQLAVPL
jgi:hypothetical protein